jgi:hypothetical protein
VNSNGEGSNGWGGWRDNWRDNGYVVSEIINRVDKNWLIKRNGDLKKKGGDIDNEYRINNMQNDIKKEIL